MAFWPSTATCAAIDTLHILGLLITGCGSQSKLVTEYGKVSGDRGAVSVNGTSVLYEMFRQRGFQTKRAKKISPRIERFGTVIWMPDNYDCPSPEAIEALENWLAEGYGRTLVYVGRDYIANADYFQHVLESEDLPDRENWIRNLAEAKVEQDRGLRLNGSKSDPISCKWFLQEMVPRRKASNISGVLTEGLEQNDASIELSTLLRPVADSAESDYLTTSTLLEADNSVFAFAIHQQDFSMDEAPSNLIVVSNGSFLLNYGLVNRSNRQLAEALINFCDAYEPVVFLESGPGGIEVSDSDAVNHNAWAWIAQPPLRYMVPHFMMWGVLFCFVFFPIFGRPKSLKTSQQSSFRAHISAMGKMLQRTKQPDQALAKIQHYREHSDRETHLRKD